MQPVSETISFHGMRVHYQVAMPDSMRPTRRVLLLNAPMSSVFNWRLLLPELNALGCMVALVDLPGYGRSACGKGVPQDAASRARLVWGVLDEIDNAGGGAQMWHLMSHGSACLTTLTMTQQAPDAVVGNVLISPVLKPQISGLCRHFPKLLDRKFEQWFAESIYSERGMRTMIQEWFGRPIPDFVLDYMRRPLMRTGMKHQLHRLIGEGFTFNESIFAGFTPTMALIGQQDPLFSAADAEELRARMPDAEVHMLHTAAHFPQETHSRAVCDYLRGWFNYIDPQDR